jgi:nitrile hydratase subunit beta
MNGVHDLGGMHGMGPIPIEKNEPAFHEPWERQMFGLMLGALFKLDLNGDEFRSTIEHLPPADYLGFRYFERWIPVLGTMLVKRGVITEAELASGRAQGGARWKPATDKPSQPSGRTPPAKREGAPARFTAGQRVRARNMHPVTHTRLPRYVRGRIGTVLRDYGISTFPDTNALDAGEKPQHVYSVRFAARELWGDQASPRDSVHLDLWDDYLESA